MGGLGDNGINMLRRIRQAGIFLIVVVAVLIGVMKFRYGGETVAFPDRSTEPVLPESALETVAKLAEAPGNIAVSDSGRVFFTFHPEGNPESMKVAELVNGQPVPFPDAAMQKSKFGHVFSVRIDRKNRLWTLDPGFHGLGTPRLMAFDLDTRELVHEWEIPYEIAGFGSYIQDFQITRDGKFVFMADTSVVALRPAIVVYDIERGEARRVLESEAPLVGKNYTIHAGGRDLFLLGGLYKMHPCIDSIVLDDHDQWLYFGAMSSETMYRVPAEDLRVASRSNVKAHAVAFGPKPQSDGLSIDSDDTVYITDVEHSSIMTLNQKKELKTLVRSPKIRWADGMSFGPEGWLYFTDSDIPDLLLQSRQHVEQSGPYYIYRVQTGKKGTPGH